MREVKDLHPNLIAKIDELQKACVVNSIWIGISECLRTVAEQNALYEKGRTEPGPRVTNCRGNAYSSMHQWGIAFDFYLNMDIDGDGKITDDAYNDSTSMFKRVGQIGQSIGLEWGGNWKSIIDQPHFQLPNWGSTASKLKKMYGNPAAFMATWPKTNNNTSLTSPKQKMIGRVTAKSGLKLRKGPGTITQHILTLSYNDVVVVDGSSGGWALVTTAAGIVGYCSEKYLAITVETPAPVVTSPTNTTTPSYAKSEVAPAENKSSKYTGVYDVAANLNMRNAAGTKGTSILTVLPKGAKVQCWGFYTMSGSTPWLLVAYLKYTGYVSMKYLVRN